MSRLIALCSPAMGSGKSTVAEHLVAEHGFHPVAFAAPIKRMTEALLRAIGIPGTVVDRYVRGDLKEKPIYDIGAFLPRYADVMIEALGPLPSHIDMPQGVLRDILYQWGVETVIPGVTSRRIQQTIGTEVGRDRIHSDLWADMGIDEAKGLMASGWSVVVDDMRFPNELRKVRDSGGIPVRVVRPGTTVAVAHASEGQLDTAEMPSLINDRTVGELLLDADSLVRDLSWVSTIK